MTHPCGGILPLMWDTYGHGARRKLPARAADG
jgi:hypothetical protein